MLYLCSEADLLSLKAAKDQPEGELSSLQIPSISFLYHELDTFFAFTETPTITKADQWTKIIPKSISEIE